MDYKTIVSKFDSFLYLLLHHWRYKMIFGAINRKCRVLNPVKIDGGKRIFLLGKNIIIANGTWLAAEPLTGVSKCRLEIGEGTKVGHYNHIYCTQSIKIESNVLIADKVYISDNLHNYEDISTPIFMQSIKQLKPVVIGTGAWLGENVCIIGANVGRGSVVGANSVVTKDIPDYCIAVGVPSKIIKRYCFDTQMWCKTDFEGNFVN